MGNKIKYIVIIVILTSCTVSKRNIKKKSEDSINETQALHENTIIRDSTYQFICQGDTIQILGRNISRAYFPVDLRQCLLREGFIGNVKANKQIADLIRLVRMNDFRVFGRDPQFRGPEVFEAFLDISEDDFSPSIDFDGNESEIKSRSQGFAHWYLEMIRTIDGISHYDYVEKLIKNHEFNNEEFIEGQGWNYEYFLEAWKLSLKGIKDAWREGLIELKNYGEE